MKKLFAIIAVVAGMLCGKGMTVQAQTLHIGENDSKTYYAPVYATWADKYYCSQILYFESELSSMKNKEITKLAFFLRKVNSSDYEHVQIRLKKVDFDAFESTDYVSVEDAVLVYEGSLPASSTMELEVTLSKTFVYEGGTLMVDVRKTEEGGGYAPTSGDAGRFQSTYFEGQSLVLYNYNNTSFPEKATNTSGNRPDIAFTYQGGPTGIESVQHSAVSYQKRIENGMLVIEKDGVKYNAIGTKL